MANQTKVCPNCGGVLQTTKDSSKGPVGVGFCTHCGYKEPKHANNEK